MPLTCLSLGAQLHLNASLLGQYPGNSVIYQLVAADAAYRIGVVDPRSGSTRGIASGFGTLRNLQATLLLGDGGGAAHRLLFVGVGEPNEQCGHGVLPVLDAHQRPIYGWSASSLLDDLLPPTNYTPGAQLYAIQATLRVWRDISTVPRFESPAAVVFPSNVVFDGKKVRPSTSESHKRDCGALARPCSPFFLPLCPRQVTASHFTYNGSIFGAVGGPISGTAAAEFMELSSTARAARASVLVADLADEVVEFVHAPMGPGNSMPSGWALARGSAGGGAATVGDMVNSVVPAFSTCSLCLNLHASSNTSAACTVTACAACSSSGTLCSTCAAAGHTSHHPWQCACDACHVAGVRCVRCEPGVKVMDQLSKQQTWGLSLRTNGGKTSTPFNLSHRNLTLCFSHPSEQTRCRGLTLATGNF